jgi:hypothetical protein
LEHYVTRNGCDVPNLQAVKKLAIDKIGWYNACLWKEHREIVSENFPNFPVARFKKFDIVTDR